jgi:hypothetical protein
MMVVDVSVGTPIRVSQARGLFEESYREGGNTPGYDIFPDGQHFVMIEVDWEASRISHFNLVLNWSEELKRLVPLR